MWIITVLCAISTYRRPLATSARRSENGLLPHCLLIGLAYDDVTTGAQYRVRLLSVGDWRLLRSTRLRALADAPMAFTPQQEDETTWRDIDWSHALVTARWLIAVEHHEVIGLVRSTHHAAEAPTSRHVEAAWVDSRHRRRGVLRSLVKKLIDVERRAGVRDLLLWVFEHNEGAQQAYARIGFVATGEPQRLNGTGPYEQLMRLAIV